MCCQLLEECFLKDVGILHVDTLVFDQVLYLSFNGIVKKKYYHKSQLGSS